jgi:hypothetical protein
MTSRSGGGMELWEVNNASKARNTSRTASTRSNHARRNPLAAAAAHGPLRARVSPPVVRGARPLRLQVRCCLYLS